MNPERQRRLTELVSRVGDRLTEQGKRIQVVETAAGGLISANLLAVPGASAWYDGGKIAYSNQFKMNNTGVRAADLDDGGAVQADIPRLMAMWGVGGRISYCLAESSLAYKRPGARSIKPAGLSYIAIATSMRDVESREYLFKGTRWEIMEQIAEAAIQFLAEKVGA